MAKKRMFIGNRIVGVSKCSHAKPVTGQPVTAWIGDVTKSQNKNNMEGNNIQMDEKGLLQNFQLKIGDNVIYDTEKDFLYQMGYGRHPGGGVYELNHNKPLRDMIGTPEGAVLQATQTLTVNIDLPVDAVPSAFVEDRRV